MGEGKGSSVGERKWNGFDQNTFNARMEFSNNKKKME